MKIVSIEPTPSPNSMKLNMDESLPTGVRETYTKKNSKHASETIQQLLGVQGVISVFHAADFIALDRTSKGDWQFILAKAREIFGEAQPSAGVLTPEQPTAEAAFGEAQVLVQMFRGIPLQVRVRAGAEEVRAGMPARFTEAAVRAGTASPNLIKERKLEELGVRYGELEDIAGEVVQELDASYDDARVESLVSLAMRETSETAPAEESARVESAGAAAEQLRHSDWKMRYAALQKIQPSLETLPLLIHALQDENTSIRRLATVYLGDIKEPEVLPFLYRALEDDTPSVRRTAGDTLSDIGDPAAMPAMAKALKDRNKLVRWRAARFLYEVGNSTVLDALHEAVDDPEFEVRMQVKIALERIEGGHAAEGSVWQQMTRRND